MTMYRTLLLNNIVSALQSCPGISIFPANVYSPGDWPTDPRLGAAIQVGREIHEEKMSTLRGQPAFTTTVHITVDGRVASNTGFGALSAIQCLADNIEQAIITDFKINSQIQQFSSVRSTQTIDSNSEYHVAQVAIAFALEFFQSMADYDTTSQGTVPSPNLDVLTISQDAINIFDATGTYSGTSVTELFPNSVVPAPRTTGGDGRDEGYLQFDNLQE